MIILMIDMYLVCKLGTLMKKYILLHLTFINMLKQWPQSENHAKSFGHQTHSTYIFGWNPCDLRTPNLFSKNSSSVPPFWTNQYLIWIPQITRIPKYFA